MKLKRSVNQKMKNFSVVNVCRESLDFQTDQVVTIDTAVNTNLGDLILRVDVNSEFLPVVEIGDGLFLHTCTFSGN